MPENEGSRDADTGSTTQEFNSQTSEISSPQTNTIISWHPQCASIACKFHDQIFMNLSRE